MIPLFKVFMNERVSEEVGKTLMSGMVGEGPKVAEFKKKLEEKFNCRNLIPLNSATSALTLALRLAGIKPEDEVVSTPYTMIATNCAIANFTKHIKFSDVGYNNVNVTYGTLKNALTKNTKAIVLTHVGGMPCDMELIKTFKLPVIADCAHAVSTYYKDIHISKWADYSCFSFQAIKQLNTGDGGALVVMDDKKYELAEQLKWFGMSRIVPSGMTRLQHQMTSDVAEFGYKFHMNDIAATIGLCNLNDFDWITQRHQDNANYYYKELAGVKGIKLFTIPETAVSSWWVFGLLASRRDELIAYLEEKGITATPMWRRNDRYTAFYCPRKLINMDKLEREIVFIPNGWWVTKKDREYIINTIKEFYE